MKRSESVDQYLENAELWRAELTTLREILRSTELEEAVKWGGPVYTFDGKNVVGLGGFKSYFGLWFFQGALLEDRKGVLINAQEGKTKALRQLRFESKREIDRRLILDYVAEAIELVRRGAEIKPDRGKPLTIPAELKAALKARPKADAAFRALTPGKRREYADHVAEAERDDTKRKRIEKVLPLIEAGGGLHDKYRKG